MGNNVFKIELDTEILKRLRDKINEQQNISYNKMYKKYRAWHKICAIMDRLDDTVEYLNTLELNTGKYKRSSFDFFDFMNNASVVIDCVKELNKIFLEQDIEKMSYLYNEYFNEPDVTLEEMYQSLKNYISDTASKSHDEILQILRLTSPHNS